MSGKTEKPVVCWDSCVFLAWFKQEKNKPLRDIARALREIKHGSVVCYVSPITRVEILNRVNAPDYRQKFIDFLKRPNIESPNVDERVIDLAADIRQRSVTEKGTGSGRKVVQTPDALIAAMAVLYKVPTIFSFDGTLLAYSGTGVL